MNYPCALNTVLVILTTFSLLFGGCAGREKTNMWPLYYRDTLENEAGMEVQRREILYPFIETRHSQDRRFFALRPLGNYEHLPDEESARLQFLWPLGLVSIREERSGLYRLWPFFQHSRTTDFFEGTETVHGWVFPVIYWGQKPQLGPYWAVLPIGGKTYGLIGEEFSWVLFPVYSFYRQGEYRRHNLLWPLFSWGATPDGQKVTRRAWPFFVRKEKEEAYRHNYLLWPFFRWGEERWETVRGEPMERDYVAFHPFYSRQTSRDKEGKAVAGQRQMFLYNRKWDSRWEEEMTQRSYLFSLIRRQHTEDIDEWRFFPVFWRKEMRSADSKKKAGGVVHHRLLWPLIWKTEDRSMARRHRSYTVFAPFLWHYRTHDTEEDVVEKSTTFWPAVTVEHGREGRLGVYILSHGWGDEDSGYKRNYRPFFEFFRYKRSPDGTSETRLLWRLFHHRRGNGKRHVSMPFLFNYNSFAPESDEKKTERTLSFLMGLIQYESGKEGGEVHFFNFFGD